MVLLALSRSETISVEATLTARTPKNDLRVAPMPDELIADFDKIHGPAAPEAVGQHGVR